MKILLIICGLTLNVSMNAQADKNNPSEILVGTWVLYKDSTASGIIPIISEETDTIQFLANGKYTRKYSTTIENGMWNYSTEKNGVILSQRIRDYFSGGQKQSYKMLTEMFIENGKISNNEFIDTLEADANANNEIIVYFRYYKRIN